MTRQQVHEHHNCFVLHEEHVEQLLDVLHAGEEEPAHLLKVSGLKTIVAQFSISNLQHRKRLPNLKKNEIKDT